MQTAQHYDSYRLFLRDAVEEWVSRSNSHSMRALAMHTGISPSYLSRVLSGQRNLTIEYAHKIQRFFKLSHEDALHFFDLIALENAATPKARVKLLKEIAARRDEPGRFLSVEKFKVVADWYHFAILSLVGTKNFFNNSAWIAGRLGIHPAEAQAAITRLLSLGLLEKKGSNLTVREIRIQTEHDMASAAVRENHRQHLGKAAEALEELEVDLREFLNRTLTMDLKDMPAAKKRLRKFMDSFNKEMERPGGEDVYQVNLQFYRISKREKGQA